MFCSDAIKDDPELFPIVNLNLLDCFYSKMRLKKEQKGINSEKKHESHKKPYDGWLYPILYKTVRKIFEGYGNGCYQELEDHN